MHEAAGNIDFDMHTHDICEIIFLKRGNVSCIIGGKTYKLFKESLIIFRPHVPHRVVLTGSEIYERYDTMMASFGAMVRGEKVNPYTYDYELDLYRTILQACGRTD